MLLHITAQKGWGEEGKYSDSYPEFFTALKWGLEERRGLARWRGERHSRGRNSICKGTEAQNGMEPRGAASCERGHVSGSREMRAKAGPWPSVFMTQYCH